MEKVLKVKKDYQAILFPIFDVLLNGGNLLIHLYISWFLNPDAYGILNALFSLLFVLMIVGMSIQTYFAKKASEPNWNPEEASEILIITKQLIIIIGSIMLLLTPVMTKLLRSSYTSYLIVLATFGFQVILSYHRGLMQGQRMFLKLNLSFYIEMGIKLALLIPLMKLFPSVEVALISVLVGIAFSYHCARRGFIKNERSQLKSSKNKRPGVLDFSLTSIRIKIYKGFLQVFSTQFFFYYFTAVVLILANYHLGEQAGLYALSTRYGQIFIHIGLSIITVLIPIISGLKNDIRSFKKRVGQMLLLYMAGGSVLLAGYSIVMPFALKLLFSSAYQGAAAVIVPQAIAYYFLSIAFLMASMEMVLGSKKYLFILAFFAVALMVALSIWNSSLESVVTIELVFYISMAVALVIQFFTRRDKQC